MATKSKSVKRPKAAKKTTKAPAKAAKKTAKKPKSAVKKAPKTAKKTAKKPVKRPAKKPAKPAAERPVEPIPVREVPIRPRTRPTWILPAILIIIALVVIGVSLYAVMHQEPATDEPVVPEDSAPAAMVGSREITMGTLNQQYDMLPEQYKMLFTKERVLEQLIDEEVVLAYADAQGVEISDEQIQEEVAVILSADLTREQLEENLANFGLTFDDFEQLIARKLAIEEAMQMLLVDVPLLTAEEVRAAYDENIENYAVDDQVTVRHILISSQQEGAAVLGKELTERVEAGEDFCDLVTEYTDDIASKDTCGEYTFGKGYMVPEFEEASYALAPGEVTMIQSQFGYHIIQKIANIPAETMPFEDVKDDIQAQLIRDAQSLAYQDWLTAQKADMDIQVFYTE